MTESRRDIANQFEGYIFKNGKVTDEKKNAHFFIGNNKNHSTVKKCAF